jgi:hypothetical protein
MLWIPLMAVGGVVYWTLALGLGGLSFLAASDLRARAWLDPDGRGAACRVSTVAEDEEAAGATAGDAFVLQVHLEGADDEGDEGNAAEADAEGEAEGAAEAEAEVTADDAEPETVESPASELSQ